MSKHAFPKNSDNTATAVRACNMMGMSPPFDTFWAACSTLLTHLTACAIELAVNLPVLFQLDHNSIILSIG